MERTMNNRDGSVDKVFITSDDNYQVKLKKQYKLVDYTGNKLIDNFKNSILGMDVGINSYNFVSKTIIATLIAVTAIVTMYFSFRI